MFSNSCSLKSGFEKLCFRDGLSRTIRNEAAFSNFSSEVKEGRNFKCRETKHISIDARRISKKRSLYIDRAVTPSFNKIFGHINYHINNAIYQP